MKAAAQTLLRFLEKKGTPLLIALEEILKQTGSRLEAGKKRSKNRLEADQKQTWKMHDRFSSINCAE